VVVSVERNGVAVFVRNMMTTEPKYRGLTERQWERLVYGTCHVLIQQALDNGELEYADNVLISVVFVVLLS
jgi:hypothetical protein